MMEFWIVTFALALMVSGLLILTLMRTRAQEDTGDSGAACDLQVYRDQLRDIDHDLARGVIGEGDAERVRIEVSRRILAADARVQKASAAQVRPDGPVTPARIMAVALVVLVVGGSVTLYRVLGAPGYGDLGLEQRIEMAREARENRPSQHQAETEMPPAPAVELDDSYKALVDELRNKVAERPDDLQGQVLLARHEAQSGNFVAAHKAQASVIRLMGDTVTSRQYSEYGELLIVAAAGYVSPEAETALRKALELDPRSGPSRYYWGMMLAQTGRPDLAFRIWEDTLRQGPPDAPWLVPIRGQIGEMAWLAGVEYTVAAAPPASSPSASPSADTPAGPSTGPSAADVAAARDMSAQDRQEMIRSMVERLSERLASEGGSPAEWARLIAALGILGETERAQSIYDEARALFASDETALSQIAQAANQAGLSQ